jgi:hypothetical protein
MQSFFRFLIGLVVLMIVFLGGWFSSDLVEKDPFLASFFNVKNEEYDRFIEDLATALKESAFTDISIGTDMENWLRDGTIDSLSGEEAEPSEEGNQDLEQTHQAAAQEVAAQETVKFDPNDMIATLVQQMSNREKITFLLWAKAKFNDQKLEQITRLLQDGVDGDNLLQLYQLTRGDLKGSDYEYLLSFLDRYLISQQESVPAWKMEEDTYGYRAQ